MKTENTEGGIRLIRLSRPEKRNAIDLEMVQAILAGIETAPGSVVVIGSTDSRAFSAGADLTTDDRQRAAISDSLYELYNSMRASPKIILTAASGYSVGAGAQLLIASDMRIVSADAAIRFAGVGHGLVVGAWGLPSLVGRGRAMDLCLTMREVGAEEALAIGLVDRVADSPMEEATQLAKNISKLDRRAIAGVKQLVNRASAEALSDERILNSGWDGSIPWLKD